VVAYNANSSQTFYVVAGNAGISGVTAVQGTLNNPSGAAVTLTNLTLSTTGSMSNITNLEVLINGFPEASDSSIPGGNTVVINLNNYVFPYTSGTGQSLQILVSYSNTAAVTNQFSVNGIAGTSANNGGQQAQFTGLPGTGDTVVVQQPTLTPTFSPTATVSPTATSSPTLTTTPAPTPLPGIVGIYPNPVTGPTVQILPPFYNGIMNVKVEVFTLAFRKVQDNSYPSIPSGTAITLSLTGRSGNWLANGIYYVVVTVNGHRSIGKLLVLR
jgi:hypothetical protein